ncbi:MAG: hypothetical protein EP329_07535 [Deltaproteobacteria bacterium]|nr:MAG: hypothetical protein EP329_07535 [Deltaproteobacteria bacterium]
MITLLSVDEVERHWAALRERLITGMHPTAGQPVRDTVPVVIFERSDDRGPSLLRRLERARAVAGGEALVAIDYDPVRDGVVGPDQGVRLDAPDVGAWLDAGDAHGWTTNGTSFVFSDDTASWVVMTLTDVLVVACEPALVAPLFGDRERAEAAYWDFQTTFGGPLNVASYRAMTRYARFDP